MHTTTASRTPRSPGRAQRVGLLLPLLAVLLSAPALLQAAAIASLDHPSIQRGDSVTLHITTSADDAGQQPDLAPLAKDFQVLGTTSSSQIQIINGKRSDRHEWLIELAPLAEGTLTIPALQVGNSTTAALTLQVSAQPAATNEQPGAAVFMQAEISPNGDDVRVQQQLLYTTRLYYRIPLVEGSFSEPAIDNAVVEQLGEDRQYDTTVAGTRYQVVERRYAVFPEHSGKLTIQPGTFNGRTLAQGNRQSSFGHMNSVIEQMLSQHGISDRFFAGTPFGDPGKPVRVSSKPLTLDVKPQADGYSGNHWLPAQELTLEDSWTQAPPTLHAGEPATRTLTLEAKGLEASQLPALAVQGSDTLRVYPEQPELGNRTDGDWIYGRSEQRFTYVPSQAGQQHFPAIEISWWDSIHHRQAKRVLPAWDVTVAPGNGKLPVTTPPSTTTTQSTPATQAGSVSAAVPATTAQQKPLLARWREYLPMGSELGFLLVVLLAWLLIRWHRKSATPAQPGHGPVVVTAPSVIPATAGKTAAQGRQALRTACTRSDPHAAASALLEWASATWPQHPPRSLGALAARCERGRDCIRALEAALYGSGQQAWNGTALWTSVQDGLDSPAPATADASFTDSGLPPLYPDLRKQAGQHPAR